MLGESLLHLAFRGVIATAGLNMSKGPHVARGPQVVHLCSKLTLKIPAPPADRNEAMSGAISNNLPYEDLHQRSGLLSSISSNQEASFLSSMLLLPSFHPSIPDWLL